MASEPRPKSFPSCGTVARKSGRPRRGRESVARAAGPGIGISPPVGAPKGRQNAPLSPHRGSDSLGFLVQGLRPWLHSGGPFGAFPSSLLQCQVIEEVLWASFARHALRDSHGEPHRPSRTIHGATEDGTLAVSGAGSVRSRRSSGPASGPCVWPPHERDNVDAARRGCPTPIRSAGATRPPPCCARAGDGWLAHPRARRPGGASHTLRTLVRWMPVPSPQHGQLAGRAEEAVSPSLRQSTTRIHRGGERAQGTEDRGHVPIAARTGD